MAVRVELLDETADCGIGRNQQPLRLAALLDLLHALADFGGIRVENIAENDFVVFFGQDGRTALCHSPPVREGQRGARLLLIQLPPLQRLPCEGGAILGKEPGPRSP